MASAFGERRGILRLVNASSRSRRISTVFSTAVEKFGERPNTHRWLAAESRTRVPV